MTSERDTQQANLVSPRRRFREAFDAHFDAITRYCLRRIAIDDVNDVVSEVFVVAWRKIDQMPDEPSTLPWLYRVAQHQISNSRRSQRRSIGLRGRLRAQPAYNDSGPEPVIVRNEELAIVLTALSSLAPKDQEILLLKTQEELTYPQIAIALNCTPDAARKRSDRALGRLKKAVSLPEPQDATPAFRAIEQGGDQ